MKKIDQRIYKLLAPRVFVWSWRIPMLPEAPAFYNPIRNEIHLVKGYSLQTLIHEYGHWFPYRIAGFCNALWDMGRVWNFAWGKAILPPKRGKSRIIKRW